MVKKEHTIQCGITAVPRVFVKRGDPTYRQNAMVYAGGILIGEVFKNGDRWVANNFVNRNVRTALRKTAAAAVKALVCGQVKAERTSRKLPY
jgi:hypothetical protein